MKQRRFAVLIAVQAERIEQLVDVVDQFRDEIAARGAKAAPGVKTLSYEGFAVVTEAK